LFVNVPEGAATNGVHHSLTHVANIAWNGALQEKLFRIRAERAALPCQTTTTISLLPQNDATEQWDGGLLHLLPLLDFLILNELEADCAYQDDKAKNATMPILIP
jgi:hypothetical protein